MTGATPSKTPKFGLGGIQTPKMTQTPRRMAAHGPRMALLFRVATPFSPLLPSRE